MHVALVLVRVYGRLAFDPQPWGDVLAAWASRFVLAAPGDSDDVSLAGGGEGGGGSSSGGSRPVWAAALQRLCVGMLRGRPVLLPPLASMMPRRWRHCRPPSPPLA